LTPASGKFLLDTNIIIALLEGDAAVLSNLDYAPEVFIPIIAVGELFFGAAKSSRPEENTAKVERFAAGRVLVECDLGVALEYGRLKQQLRENGKSGNTLCRRGMAHPLRPVRIVTRPQRRESQSEKSARRGTHSPAGSIIELY